MAATTIYQRTQAGRDEIRDKQVGLTQSERQVLIMIDGVAPCQDVRRKLAGLTDERFERALRALLKLGLVGEVFLPIAGQAAEQLDREIVDRFLQQDAADPVTIISYDPEEEFGDIPPRPAEVTTTAIPELDVIVSPVPAVDEAHARLADSLQEELKARQLERKQAGVLPAPQPSSMPPPMHAVQAEASGGNGWHWGYWLIGVGLVLIAGFVAARLVR